MTTVKIVLNPEYLRRNLLVCSAVGALASIETVLAHVRKLKRQPKWLLKHLEMAQERAVKLPPALACYRSGAPTYIESPTQQHGDGPK